MSPLRLLLIVGGILGLGACGGGSSAPPSYTLTAATLNPSSVTAGTTSTAEITVTPVNGYTGSITLSCTIAGGTPGPGCSLSPSALTISGSSASSSTLTVATSSGTAGGTYSIAVSADDAHDLAPSDGAQTLNLTVTAVIQHVVVIFQENRTPDNLFQDPVLIARGADIVSSGKNSLGQTIPLAPIDLGTAGPNPQNYDLGHAHAEFVSMYDGGKMDGANPDCTSGCQMPSVAHPNPQFMYVNTADVQPYFAMAEQYTFGDRMFQTNQGPSFPAHQFITGRHFGAHCNQSPICRRKPDSEQRRVHRSADHDGHDDRRRGK